MDVERSCPATMVMHGGTYRCVRETGHDGAHHDGPGPEWKDAPAAKGRITESQIQSMPTGEVIKMLRRFDAEQLIGTLMFIVGYSPDVVAEAIRPYVCAVQADADNACILPAGHAESHDAGEFTWDVWPEDMHTIAAK